MAAPTTIVRRATRYRTCVMSNDVRRSVRNVKTPAILTA